MGAAMVYRTDVMRITRFLPDADMFAGLSERDLDRVAGLCEERRFAPGGRLGTRGDPGDRLLYAAHVARGDEVSASVDKGADSAALA